MPSEGDDPLCRDDILNAPHEESKSEVPQAAEELREESIPTIVNKGEVIIEKELCDRSVNLSIGDFVLDEAIQTSFEILLDASLPVSPEKKEEVPDDGADEEVAQDLRGLDDEEEPLPLTPKEASYNSQQANRGQSRFPSDVLNIDQ